MAEFKVEYVFTSIGYDYIEAPSFEAAVAMLQGTETSLNEADSSLREFEKFVEIENVDTEERRELTDEGGLA